MGNKAVIQSNHPRYQKWIEESGGVIAVRWNETGDFEEWLIKWKDHPECDATWEAAT